ncbi:hypothetical protein L2E82_15523 [Cichorium intybus]|uniref:Uncharacterized protein n=1 Tax=Cichorium intybus TaxID=13427 RepID=A0ACB9F2C7_CICIN|nr:hypothetical protein L2E82_15523 [Cichorium intybus]
MLCPVDLPDMETVDHVFLRHEVAKNIWDRVFNWWKCAPLIMLNGGSVLKLDKVELMPALRMNYDNAPVLS